MDLSVTNFFYVLAMPRSRTLWLSFLLSDDDSYCGHELLTDFGSKKLEDSGKKYTGSVDTNPLNAIEYDGPLVVIKRDIAEVRASLKDNFHVKGMGNEDFSVFVDNYSNSYSSALNDKSAYIVDYEDLNDPAKVLLMVRFLKPDTEITIERIKYLQSCVIKTKNDDLTASYNSLQSEVTVTRTLDVGLCLSVLTMPDIFDSISEDGATFNDLKVDVVDQYWLSVFDKGLLLGVVQFKPTTSSCYESHIHIIKKHRKKYAKEAGEAILKWCKDNLKGTLYAHTPSYCENVIKFLRSFHFQDTGLMPSAWKKNGKLNDLIILTRVL